MLQGIMQITMEWPLHQIHTLRNFIDIDTQNNGNKLDWCIVSFY